MTKYTVEAPEYPGSEPSVIGQFDAIADARKCAEKFEHRKDLRMQDVVIRCGDKVIEKCGPCR